MIPPTLAATHLFFIFYIVGGGGGAFMVSFMTREGEKIMQDYVPEQICTFASLFTVLFFFQILLKRKEEKKGK